MYFLFFFCCFAGDQSAVIADLGKLIVDSCPPMLCTGLDCAVVTERNGCQVCKFHDFKNSRNDIKQKKKKRKNYKQSSISGNISFCKLNRFFFFHDKLKKKPNVLYLTAKISFTFLPLPAALITFNLWFVQSIKQKKAHL